MPEYWARRSGSDPWSPDEWKGPYPDYMKAMYSHSDYIRRITPLGAAIPKLQVLVDLGSLPTSHSVDLHDLLDSDPILKALFDLGRRVGFEEGVSHRA